TSDAPHQHHHSQPPSGVHLFDGGHLINSTCRAVGGRPITLTVEPVIGHLKADHRMGRNYLAHATGDAINVVLAAAGYNFRRLLAWLALLWALFLSVLDDANASNRRLIAA
ncbi:MAG: IS5/IS1182 family transposase, partial [Pseudorhodoplanes sp.]